MFSLSNIIIPNYNLQEEDGWFRRRKPKPMYSEKVTSAFLNANGKELKLKQRWFAKYKLCQ